MTEKQQSYCVQRSLLQGKVRVSGAKNSALRLLAASLLTSEAVQLSNYPASLLDAQVHGGMLEALGKTCTVQNDSITITEKSPPPRILSWDGRSIRNTLLILGALTARQGCGAVPIPGGCQLGERKFDLHEMLLEALGARVYFDNGLLATDAPNGLIGADIRLPFRSTGATENAIIAGSLAKGTTRVWNPHIRPEIIDLCSFMRSMGVDIQVHGQEHIEIHGQAKLCGAKHRVVDDNMEALTWLIAGSVCGGEIEIEGFPEEHLEVPLVHLRESGVHFRRLPGSVVVSASRSYPVDICTGPYPGINSDMQPLFAVYGALSRGTSRIIDLRFPGRYGYAEELAKMGVQCSVQGSVLEIEGGRSIIGTEVNAVDLRAGVALVVAGLVGEGRTIIRNSWQVERGYDRFLEKVNSLGGLVAVYDG